MKRRYLLILIKTLVNIYINHWIKPAAAFKCTRPEAKSEVGGSELSSTD